MLKIYAPKKGYSLIPHLIKTQRWGESTEEKLMPLMIKFWCDEQEYDRTPTKFHTAKIEPYNKKAHRKKLCESCVKAIREYTKKK